MPRSLSASFHLSFALSLLPIPCGTLHFLPIRILSSLCWWVLNLLFPKSIPFGSGSHLWYCLTDILPVPCASQQGQTCCPACAIFILPAFLLCRISTVRTFFILPTADSPIFNSISTSSETSLYLCCHTLVRLLRGLDSISIYVTLVVSQAVALRSGGSLDKSPAPSPMWGRCTDPPQGLHWGGDVRKHQEEELFSPTIYQQYWKHHEAGGKFTWHKPLSKLWWLCTKPDPPHGCCFT